MNTAMILFSRAKLEKSRGLHLVYLRKLDLLKKHSNLVLGMCPRRVVFFGTDEFKDLVAKHFSVAPGDYDACIDRWWNRF